MSSGVYVQSFEDHRDCAIESIEGVDCEFDGLVEIFYDPETQTQWWDCPLCGYEHVRGDGA